MSSVAADNTRGAIKFTARNLQEANATTMVDEVQMVDAETTEVTVAAEPPAEAPHDEPVVEVITAHDYSSSDFEYVSTRPSRSSKKGSKRGGKGGKGGKGYYSSSSKKGSGSSHRMGGHSKSGQIITAQPTIMEAPTPAPSNRPTAMNEDLFVLDDIMLFYIPTGQSIRLPTTLENAELLELTNSYIDWFFKNEYPDTALTDLREVTTEFVGINFIIEGEAIEKRFQPKVIFANSVDLPTRAQLQETLSLAFNDDYIEQYMEWLSRPYPPPPDSSTGELSSGNIFKGADVFNERPVLTSGASTEGTNYTNIMAAAAAVGFTLFVTGVVLSQRNKEGDKPTMEVKDLEKQQGGNTVAGETMTVTSGSYVSNQTNSISPLSHYNMDRGKEEDKRQPVNDNSLLLPSWGADKMVIDEESMEDVPISTNASSRRDESEETTSESWSDENKEMDDGVIHLEEVINLEEMEDQDTAPEEVATPEKIVAEEESQPRAYVDRQAVSNWRKQRGEEYEVIELLDVASFDSLEEPYSDSSESSTTEESIQRPKSMDELAAMLSSQLPSERNIVEEDIDEAQDSEEPQIEPIIDDMSDKPKTVKGMANLFSKGSMGN